MVMCGCVATGNARSAQVYAGDSLPKRDTGIQLIRRGTSIQLTNTSATSFGTGTIWLNGAFGHPIDGFSIGQTIKLSLHNFRNAFGERFRAGGFFATERPEPVVMAELQDGDEMLRLIVVEDQVR